MVKPPKQNNNIDINNISIDVSGGILIDNFNKFLVKCNRAGVSDITIQGGDYIYLFKHNKNYRVSKGVVKAQTMPQFLSIFGTDVEPTIMGGVAVNKSYEVIGTEYGLEPNEKIRFRCNFIQATVGKTSKTTSITMRVLSTTIMSLDELKVPDELRRALNIDMGLVVIGGPTGSGKTLLRSSWLEYVISTTPDKKIVTYENPVENILGLTKDVIAPIPAQSELGRDFSDWGKALSSALRRNPKILDVGEASSLDTIRAVVEATLTGILTFTTSHIASAADIVSRMINGFPLEEQNMIAFKLLDALKVVIAQRLVPKKNGGVIPIREIFIMNEDFREKLEVIEHKYWASEIRKKLKEEEKDMPTVAWKLVLNDVISEDTYIHIFGEYMYKKKKDEE